MFDLAEGHNYIRKVGLAGLPLHSGFIGLKYWEIEEVGATIQVRTDGDVIPISTPAEIAQARRFVRHLAAQLGMSVTEAV